MLVLAADEEREAAVLGERGKAGVIVEPGFVRATVVVEVGLAEVEAILEDGTADAHRASLGGMNTVKGAATGCREALLGDAFLAQFVEQSGQNGLRLFVTARENVVLRALQDV